MSRVIRLPTGVETCPDGAPSFFTWRGERYRMLSPSAPWVLQDRWWVSPAEADTKGGKSYSHRLYFRVHARASGASSVLWCDLYCNRAQKVWMLEKMHD